MKYRTIVADPPWDYPSPGALAQTIKADGSVAIGVNVSVHYATMPTADIAALPIRALVNTDAHLYLWTTNAFMVEAHAIAKAWGFEQKTIITWGKVHQADHQRASMKTGYYFRGATEHCLFCVRGSLKTVGTWPTLFLWPRIGEHSVKPEAFYDLVEQASPGPYVELFSRRHRLGWDVWGKESANTAQLEAEPI